MLRPLGRWRATILVFLSVGCQPTPDTTQLANNFDLVSAVAFSPNGDTLAAADFLGKEIALWHLDDPRQPILLNDTNIRFRTLAFSPDGKLLAVGTAANGVTLWNVTNGKKIATLGNADNSGVLSLAFSPDSGTLATGDTYSRVKLWDVASQTEIATLSGHTSIVLGLAFSPDGRLLASGSGDGSLKLWNLAQRQERWTKTIAENARVEDVVFLRDGQTLVTIVNGLNRYHPFIASKAPPPTNLTVSALMVLDATSGRKLQVMGMEAANRYALSLSADGRQLATCGTTIDQLEELQNFVQIWDLETREIVAKLQYSGDGMLTTLDVAFSPTRPTVAFGFEETVQLWDLSEWREPSFR